MAGRSHFFMLSFVSLTLPQNLDPIFYLSKIRGSESAQLPQRNKPHQSHRSAPTKSKPQEFRLEPPSGPFCDCSGPSDESIAVCSLRQLTGSRTDCVEDVYATMGRGREIIIGSWRMNGHSLLLMLPSIQVYFSLQYMSKSFIGASSHVRVLVLRCAPDKMCRDNTIRRLFAVHFIYFFMVFARMPSLISSDGFSYILASCFADLSLAFGAVLVQYIQSCVGYEVSQINRRYKLRL